MKKAAVIGLDGVSWSILNMLFRHKAMPNLHELIRNSVRGILPSTIPPESAPCWTSIATGVNPGKHGIFGFTRPNKNFDDIQILSSHDVKYLRIHEMVAVQNLKSVCVNQLLTYPIKRITGSYVITSWLSPEIKYSPEIGQYARKYRGPTLSRPTTLFNKDWDAEYADLSSRVDTVNTLMQKIDWDLFWVIYSESDHLLHRYYDLVTNRERNVMRLFGKIDETFGLVKEIADLVIVVSDHGFTKYNYAVYMNTLLERLRLAKRSPHQTSKRISCQRQIGEPKIRFHLPESLYRYFSVVPSPIEVVLLKMYKRLVKADMKVLITTHIDTRSSKAFAHGFGIYVKEKDLIGHIVRMLQKTNFVKGLWKKEELYNGKYLENLPDIIVLPNFDGGFALRGDVITPKTVMRREFPSHHPNGVFMIYKKDLIPSWIKGVQVYDIVPTVLDFLELPIPNDTDGKVLNLEKERH